MRFQKDKTKEDQGLNDQGLKILTVATAILKYFLMATEFLERKKERKKRTKDLMTKD
jgi:hypothetical protein